MNGFRNKKELENYWFYSQLSTSLICIGMFSFLFNELLYGKAIELTIFTMVIIAFSYFLTIGAILILPFIINKIFINKLSQGLPYWYVKYMWANSKTAILVILAELPEDILKEKELIKLHQNVNEAEQIKLLIYVWHKNFSTQIKQELKENP